MQSASVGRGVRMYFDESNGEYSIRNYTSANVTIRVGNVEISLPPATPDVNREEDFPPLTPYPNDEAWSMYGKNREYHG